MARRGKNVPKTDETMKRVGKTSRRRGEPDGPNGLPAHYWEACRLAHDAQYAEARAAYARLGRKNAKPSPRLCALIQNDLAVIDAMEGKFDGARDAWRAVLAGDCACLPARLNLGLVEAELAWTAPAPTPVTTDGGPALEASEPVTLPIPHGGPAAETGRSTGSDGESSRARGTAVRVAVISLLFNWPSTGGGNMHTAGLVEFLGRDGYDVRHFYARYPAWGVGRVTREDGGRRAEDGGNGDQGPGADTLGQGEIAASHAIEFDDREWSVHSIRQRFREAVDSIGPDYVVITDTWNMKPQLAEAMEGYPTILIQQAQECICPLNNLRLLGIGPVKPEQCTRNQLATPGFCDQCLKERGGRSGPLHQVERALAEVGTAEYELLLHRAYQKAAAVLVLNPITAAMLEPFANRVRIVPWGIDPARFPWPASGDRDSAPGEDSGDKRVATLFMAAVAGETIKGFHVAHEACRILRETRNDFEFVVTFDPAGPIDEFTRSVGWRSQSALTTHYRAADICLVPTVAQDGLSITSVEAMAAGRPVIASRIGGLPYTVTDGLTGLLFEPGNPWDLAEKIGQLLDNPALRRQMGLAGRRRFEEDFMWPDVIKRYWRPLLAPVVGRSRVAGPDLRVGDGRTGG